MKKVFSFLGDVFIEFKSAFLYFFLDDFHKERYGKYRQNAFQVKETLEKIYGNNILIEEIVASFKCKDGKKELVPNFYFTLNYKNYYFSLSFCKDKEILTYNGNFTCNIKSFSRGDLEYAICNLILSPHTKIDNILPHFYIIVSKFYAFYFLELNKLITGGFEIDGSKITQNCKVDNFEIYFWIPYALDYFTLKIFIDEKVELSYNDNYAQLEKIYTKGIAKFLDEANFPKLRFLNENQKNFSMKVYSEYATLFDSCNIFEEYSFEFEDKIEKESKKFVITLQMSLKNNIHYEILFYEDEKIIFKNHKQNNTQEFQNFDMNKILENL